MMNAKTAIQLVVEGRTPNGWATTHGIYANLSKWPAEVEYYVKCPVCGLIHGSYKSMKEAHSKKLCDLCNVEAINKLKDEVQKVVTDPEHKPKSMAKIVGEAEEFNPFDTPLEKDDLAEPPEEHPDDVVDIAGNVDRMLLGNWVAVALREMADDLDVALNDLVIDSHWSERSGNYDPDDSSHTDTTALKLDVNGQEWLLFKNDDEAVKYALEIVSNDLNDSPEIFTQSWLRDFVDTEKLRDAIGDPYEDWSNDVENMDYDELLDKMVEEGYTDEGEGLFFKLNGEHRVQNPVRYKALRAIKDDYIEKEKPTWEPWEWLEDVYGKEDAIKEGIRMAGIDIAEAAKSAVSTDGWPHFVARYDGHSHEVENGAVYCRIN